MRRSSILVVISLLVSVAASPSSGPAADDAAGAKAGQVFRDAGKGFKEFGKKVGQAGKQVGHEVADAAKKVWYKGRQVSKPKLEQVQVRTRGFWAEVIEVKDRTLEDLRRENADLQRRVTENRKER